MELKWLGSLGVVTGTICSNDQSSHLNAARAHREKIYCNSPIQLQTWETMENMFLENELPIICLPLPLPFAETEVIDATCHCGGAAWDDMCCNCGWVHAWLNPIQELMTVKFEVKNRCTTDYSIRFLCATPAAISTNGITPNSLPSLWNLRPVIHFGWWGSFSVLSYLHHCISWDCFHPYEVLPVTCTASQCWQCFCHFGTYLLQVSAWACNDALRAIWAEVGATKSKDMHQALQDILYIGHLLTSEYLSAVQAFLRRFEKL